MRGGEGKRWEKERGPRGEGGRACLVGQGVQQGARDDDIADGLRDTLAGENLFRKKNVARVVGGGGARGLLGEGLRFYLYLVCAVCTCTILVNAQAMTSTLPELE